MYQPPSKPVTVTSPDGEVKVYDSMRIASEAIGVSYNHLRVIKAQGNKVTRGHKVSFS